MRLGKCGVLIEPLGLLLDPQDDVQIRKLVLACIHALPSLKINGKRKQTKKTKRALCKNVGKIVILKSTSYCI